MKRMISLALAAALVAGCQAREEAQGLLGEIEQNPAAYYGNAVTVTGEVEELWSPNVFKIDDNGAELLVILPRDVMSQAGQLSQGTPVQVDGIVTAYRRVEIERDHDVGDELEVEIDYEEGGPAIIAQQLSVPGAAPGAAPVVPQEAAPAEPEPGLLGGAPEQPEAEQPEITAGEAPLGKGVMAPQTAQIVETLGEGAYLVRMSDGQEMPMYFETTPSGGALQAGQSVQVYGAVRSMPDDAMVREQWKLDDAGLQRLEGHDDYFHATGTAPGAPEDDAS